MKIVVLKFGGSSLVTCELRQKVIDIINSRKSFGFSPVIVVSALGRKDDAYATDTLLSLLPSGSSDRHQAMISACGEIISATILAEELNQKGIPAKALTGWQAGLLTEKKFTQANVQNIDVSLILEELENGIIPVVCGFQGISADGEITTLGRGGSDTSAALLARSLQAEQLELFKDVAGLFTADPHLVKSARVIKKLNYDEIAELSGNGAQIIHNPAIRQLVDYQIPLLFCNTFSGKPGTCIQPCRQLHPVTAVTSKNNLSLISINSSRNSRLSDIFSAFADSSISVDFITVDQTHVSFVIDNDKDDLAEKLLKTISFDYKLQKEFCKITITGSGMTGQPGVMAKLSLNLESDNIWIDMATDSYSTISCLIRQEDEIKALNIIHTAFELQEE